MNKLPLRLTATALLLSSISGCISTGTGVSSEFQTPVNGRITPSNLDTRVSSGNQFFNGAGYTYTMGLDRGKGDFVGFAGLVEPDLIAAPTATGSAIFDGTASGYFIDRATSDESVTPNLAFREDITLNINFDTGLITGGTDGGSDVNKHLTVTATSTGGDITGTVSMTGFNGSNTVNGDLIGKLSDTRLIGAMHGEDGEDLFAGGMIASD